MNNIFKFSEVIPCDLRKPGEFQRSNFDSVKFGTDSVSYLAAKMWSVVSETSRNC